MSTENKIVGSVTVSAPFEREWKTYDAEVVFNLHEDGQKSLRSQSVNDGLHIVYDQDFQEEAYALLHAWDTSELQLEVAELKRENAALRAYKNLAEGLDKLCASYRTGRAPSDATFDKIAKARAALSPQEAAQAAKEGR